MQNLAVGLAHTFAGQYADVAYRFLNALRDKAITRAELLPVFVHVVAQNAGIHSRCNFRRARGFCAVAYHPGINSNGVDNCVLDFFQPTAV